MEIELKFQIPPHRLAAVQRAVATASAETSRLRARYFDTADQRLAQAAMALRLRLEDGTWVQTLKGQGDGRLQRLEHEVVLGPQRRVPAIDPALHQHSPAGAALQTLLGTEGAGALALRFETEVERTHRLVRRGAARVELALDQGELRAGPSSAAIREIEFELKQGDIQELLLVTRPWIQRHGLWLDVRSKAQRGELLAQGRQAEPARSARAPVLQRRMSPAAALQCMVSACLDQILPNAAAVADGTGGPEHLHQTRVGLRRLRSALDLFGDWSGATQPEWREALSGLCRSLGAARDQDVLRDTLWPQLQAAAGAMPALVLSSSTGSAPEQASDPGACLRSTEGNLLWLDLLAFCHAETDATDESDLRARAQPALKGLTRQLARDAKRFTRLSLEQRHRCRKRVKCLRYGLELLGSVLPKRDTRRQLTELQACQQALGDYLDLSMAGQRLAEAPAPCPPEGLWFARGWLAARQPVLAQQAERALADWRRRHA